jgi:outer membrane murein-binding lipoprotein Lpp
MSSSDFELLAQQVSGLNEKVAGLEQRMTEVEKVNARLEQAALTTARALQESGHWDAVYEAMRRAETVDSQDEGTSAGSSKE